MQEESKRPMTLEELMGDVKRQSFTLADGKPYQMKNPGDLTPNQRRKLTEDRTRIISQDDMDFEDYDALQQSIMRALFHEKLPKRVTENTSPDEVAALLNFFYGRTLPQADLEDQLSGDTSEVSSSDSTE